MYSMMTLPWTVWPFLFLSFSLLTYEPIMQPHNQAESFFLLLSHFCDTHHFSRVSQHAASWIKKKRREKLRRASKGAATILSSLHCVLHVSVSMTSQTLESRTRTLLRLVPHENAATALSFPIFPNLQEVKSIGSSHNRSALPFSGFGSTVVTSHYNSPAGLYSSENIRDFNSAVDEVKTMTTAPEANTK